MGGGGGGQPGTGNSQVGNTGGTTGITGAVIPPPPAWAKLGVNTQQGYDTLMQTQAPGATAAQKGQAYNSLLSQGFGNEAIRSSADTLFGKQSDVDWNSLVQQGGMQAPGGRPLAGSAQFYQPVYQPQYQDLNTGNRMGVSQYGQQPFFGGGGFSGGFGSAMPQMQTPFNFGGQMMGGGYGQFGMNNPFSPYSNSFLNMPSNLNQMGQADKVGFYQNAMGRGFNDQQILNQATGLFGYQSPQDWSYLQNQAAQMAPMQSPFRSSGPASRIVSRSSQARGTPNVMRRAEGGIASLMDDE